MFSIGGGKRRTSGAVTNNTPIEPLIQPSPPKPSHQRQQQQYYPVNNVASPPPPPPPQASAPAHAPEGSAQKVSESERKRQIEAAAARRYASGTIFPGTTYRLDKTIGKGSYGRVKLATDLRNGERLAIKFIAKASMVKPAHWTRVRREINLMSLASHPHIIRLHEWKETAEDVMIVMDFVTGKDLFERINEKKERRYSEAEARPIFRQLVSALDYCHQNRIVHRDLKPENVMIDERGSVKLIDFGFANLFNPRAYLSTNCGSPLYAAPEIVQAKPYVGPEVDIWSLGIVLYAMLVGALPFEDENLKGLYKKIGEGKFIFPDHVSPSARELIKAMLRVDVIDRATIAQIRFSSWVLEGIGFPPESFLPIRPNTIKWPRDDVLRIMRDQYGHANVDATRSMMISQPDSSEFAVYCMVEEKLRREAKLQRAKESLMMEATATAAGNPGMQQPNQQKDLMQSSTSSTVKTVPILTAPNQSTRKVYAQPSPQAIQQQQGPCASNYMATCEPSYWREIEGGSPVPRYLDMPLVDVAHSPTSPQALSSTGGTRSIPPMTPQKSQSEPSGIMAQAAANVVNKFRKFRDLKFGGLKPSSNINATASSMANGSASPKHPLNDVVHL